MNNAARLLKEQQVDVVAERILDGVKVLSDITSDVELLDELENIAEAIECIKVEILDESYKGFGRVIINDYVNEETINAEIRVSDSLDRPVKFCYANDVVYVNVNTSLAQKMVDLTFYEISIKTEVDMVCDNHICLDKMLELALLREVVDLLEVIG